MVWGFCYLRIFKKMHSISGRSLVLGLAITFYFLIIIISKFAYS
jgi:hypothetical protein